MRLFGRSICLLYTNRYICIMKFKPRSEATRQLIIETTAPIFNRKGYVRTSLADLIEATKLTKGSIYGNFENKEDIALATFDYNTSMRMGIIRERVAQAETYKEKLLVYATIFTTKENSVFPEGGCPILNMSTDANDSFDAMRQKVAECLMIWRSDIRHIIEKGIEAKEFRADANAGQISLTMVALTEGAIMIAMVTQSLDNLDTILETLKTIALSIEENR